MWTEHVKQGMGLSEVCFSVIRNSVIRRRNQPSVDKRGMDSSLTVCTIPFYPIPLWVKMAIFRQASGSGRCCGMSASVLISVIRRCRTANPPFVCQLLQRGKRRDVRDAL